MEMEGYHGKTDREELREEWRRRRMEEAVGEESGRAR